MDYEQRSVAIERGWPWVRGFRRIIRTIAEPPIAGDVVLSGWDASGTHKTSNYTVHGFIVVDAYASRAWPSVVAALRGRFLPDARRMSFKGLNDRHRRELLVPFLEATECLSGVCCVVGVHKQYVEMATDAATRSLFSGWTKGSRDKHVAEATLRAVLMWSLLVSEVCAAVRALTWVLDEDELAANESRHDDLLHLAGKFGSFLLRQVSELCVCTTGSEGAHAGFEDFIAIPDLAAGAFAETLNKLMPQTSADTSEGRYELRGESPKAGLISDWFFSSSERFRRVAILLDAHASGLRSVRRIEML